MGMINVPIIFSKKGIERIGKNLDENTKYIMFLLYDASTNSDVVRETLEGYTSLSMKTGYLYLITFMEKLPVAVAEDTAPGSDFIKEEYEELSSDEIYYYMRTIATAFGCRTKLPVLIITTFTGYPSAYIPLCGIKNWENIFNIIQGIYYTISDNFDMDEEELFDILKNKNHLTYVNKVKSFLEATNVIERPRTYTIIDILLQKHDMSQVEVARELLKITGMIDENTSAEVMNKLVKSKSHELSDWKKGRKIPVEKTVMDIAKAIGIRNVSEINELRECFGYNKLYESYSNDLMKIKEVIGD